MPTLRALRRMLSSDIKPLKAGLQEKTQSSLILCVTWHLFGAAFLLHRVWGGIQIEVGGGVAGRWQGSSSQNGSARKIHRLSYEAARHPGEAAAAVGRKANPYVRENGKDKKTKKTARRAAARPAAAFGYNVPQSRGFNARL